MYLGPRLLKEHTLLDMARDTHIAYIAHVQVNAAEPATEVGATHLHGAGYRGIPTVALHRLTGTVELEIPTDPFGGRGSRLNGPRPLDFHALVALWPHALRKHHALRAVSLFLAAWFEARPAKCPQGPAILLHKIGITFLAVEL
jgi:hypothetical protein